MPKNRLTGDELEDQARDIIRKTALPGQKDTGIDEELVRKLDGAGIAEIDEIERMMSVHTPSEDRDEPHGTRAAEATADSVTIDEDVLPNSMVRAVDGAFVIRVSEDKMSASIDITAPAGGGKPVSFAEVKSELAAMKIVNGVNYELLKRVIAAVEKTGQGKKEVVFAQGMASEDGKDGSIEIFLSEDAGVLRDENITSGETIEAAL
jgi:hypothetical protein